MTQQIYTIPLGGVNAYLIQADTGYILVDTGGHLILDKEFDNRRKQLEASLDEHGCNKNNIKAVILTHGDNDHVCNAAWLRDTYHAPIVMHKDDLKLVQNPEISDFMASFQYRSLAFRIIFRLLHKQILAISEKTLREFQTFTPDHFVTDGQSLSEYGLSATVLHLPGHTHGSIGILLENGDLIAGDTLANNKKPEKAANALDFKQLDESIERLKTYSIKKVYPGHGTPYTC